MNRRRAIIEMIFAGSLWGFGFIATVWALRSFSTTETLFYRFLLASIVGGIYTLFQKHSADASLKSDLLLALPAGLLLAGMMWPQTQGLHTTTAAKSGFLTTVYVVLVPLLGPVLFRKKLRMNDLVNAIIALIGIALLVELRSAEVAAGDLWTLLCALIAAIHILYIDRISGKLQAPFRFNTLQSMYCGLALLPALLMQPEIHFHSAEWIPWVGILFLAIGSSVVAFTIQLRAQRVLNPSTASVLFLLESPFALLFGILLLKEGFSLIQLAGACLIFAATWRSARASSAPLVEFD